MPTETGAAKGMVWSKRKPDAPGFYYWREGNRVGVSECRMSQYRGLMFGTWYMDEPELDALEFAGPIPLAVEPEASDG